MLNILSLLILGGLAYLHNWSGMLIYAVGLSIGMAYVIIQHKHEQKVIIETTKVLKSIEKELKKIEEGEPNKE